ncbi:MAG: aldehyde dehydrogenase family protein [Proteobacteria bacterium]|nr:aldehyde dehydrogenase family protein [Pseudomonadota bacterium]
MTTKTLEEWSAAAEAIEPRTNILIDGEWQESHSGDRFETVNPATGLTIADVASGATEDVDAAVRSARTAFADGRWSNLAPRERGQVLIKLAELIEYHGEELQLLETLDVGKPIRYSRRVDVGQAASTYAWYGEAADKLYDEIAPTGPDALGLITREPVGVVGAVTPWNFPLMINSWKLAPALAAGNSVVLKPAEQSPLSALRLAELALEAGLPPGVLNVVPGYGETAGRALGLHPGVDAITFTGSTEVGKLFLEYSARSNMKRVSAETGGKTPNIIFADAPDLKYAIGAVGVSIFWNTGEMCIAGSRLLVERSIYDEVVERVGELSGAWTPGNPLDPTTKAGPIVDGTQLDRVTGYIERGVEQGARLVAGGNRTLTESGGFYIEPTVFADVRNDMDIARDEIFGPVLSIIPFDDDAQALSIANDTRYGLSAAVWTSNLARAHTMAAALQAGTVWVNNFDTSGITAPFGGYKESGFGGKDKSLHALDKYTHLKTTWINLGRGGV